MKPKTERWAVVFTFLALLAPAAFSLIRKEPAAAPSVLIGPGGASGIQWTAEERAKPFAKKDLGADAHSSRHLIYLKEPEKPHVHERSDLLVFVLKGKGSVHIRDQAFPIKKGDVVEIPQNTPHWAETENTGPMEVYAV